MNNHTRRSYSTLAIAIVVAAVIIGAAILDSSTLHTTVTSTSTATSTTTSIATETQTQTTTLTQGVTSTATTTKTSTATATTTMTAVLTTTSTFTSTDYPFVAPQLQVQVNATTIRPGGALMASISLLNVLPYNLSVIPGTQSNSSIAGWNGYDFLCGGDGGWNPIWSLAGYAVFEGHYSPANISSAGSPLTIRAPLDIECPVSADPDKIVFLPDSSQVIAYFSSTPFENASIVTGEASMNATTMTCALLPANYVSCDTNMSLFGYWNSTTPPYGNAQDANATSPYFHYFSPGQYTLAVEDMWGETTYVYFQVVTANPPSA